VIFISRLRWLLALVILFAIAALNLSSFPQASLWSADSRKFTTVEIIQDPAWVKGTATLLAAEFDSVQVFGLAEGDEALSFDSELARIYGIQTDSSQTAIDLISRPEFAVNIATQRLVRFEFETFCKVEGSQYCQLALVWEPGSTALQDQVDFETVRIAKSEFALVERSLLIRLAQELNLELSQRVPE